MKKWIWALVVLAILCIFLVFVAIPLGILWYVTAPAIGGVTCQSMNNNFIVMASAVLAGPDGVNVTLMNGTGKEVTVNSVTGAGDFSGAGTVTGSQVLANATFKVQGIDAPSAGSTFDNGKVTVNVTYGNQTADFEVVCTGKV